MKALKNLSFVFGITTLLVACDPISGQLQVSQSFNVKTAAGDPRMGGACPQELYPCDYQEEVIAIEPGSHSMSLSQFGGNNIRINLKNGRKDMNIDLALPKNQDIPATGHITLKSQQTGQPFDLEADTQTNVSETEPRQDVESCEIVWEERVCEMVSKGPNAARERECRMERFSRPGSRDVEFFYRTTKQDMQAQIYTSAGKVANFNGSRTSTSKIYLYEGPCIENFHGGRPGRFH